MAKKKSLDWRWIRYRDKLWIPHRKRTYLYWFKFLQLSEQDPNRNIDWSKYNGWGGANAVLGMKFDDWWKDHWVELFGIKNEGDEPKFPLTTKRPKKITPKISATDLKNLAITQSEYEKRQKTSTNKSSTALI